MKTIGIFLLLISNATLLGQEKIFSNNGELYVNPETIVSTYNAFINHETGSVINDGEIHFYSDYNNDGLVHYTVTNGGYVVFKGVGSAVQYITGGEVSNFYDVLFDKPGSGHSFHIANEVTIANKGDFKDGIVLMDKLQGGKLTFLKEAVAVNVSDNSYVEGETIKRGDHPFVYPIGKKGYYRFSGISAPEDETHHYLGEYHLQNSDLEYPHKQRTEVIKSINNTEYWTVHQGEGTEGSIVLTLSWNEQTTPYELHQEEGEGIRIVRWDEAQKLWVDEGGIVDFYTRTVTSPVKVEGFGVFTLGSVKQELMHDGDVVIYNGVSPDGDGMNDYFIIDNIHRFPQNTLTIYNRWGREVYRTSDYGSNGNVFKGQAEGVRTFNSGEKLPTGTYYYVLDYLYDHNNENRTIRKTGYLHLENN